MTSLSQLTDQLLSAATKAGADAADAIATDGRSLSIEVRDGALEQAERAEGIEIGLRVLIGKRQACVSASDTSAATIDENAGLVGGWTPHVTQIQTGTKKTRFGTCGPTETG